MPPRKAAKAAKPSTAWSPAMLAPLRAITRQSPPSQDAVAAFISTFDENTFSTGALVELASFELSVATTADEDDFDFEDAQDAWKALLEHLPESIVNELDTEEAALRMDIESCLTCIRQEKPDLAGFAKQVKEQFSRDHTAHMNKASKVFGEMARKCVEEKNKTKAQQLRSALLKKYPLNDLMQTLQKTVEEVREAIDKVEKAPTEAWAKLASAAKATEGESSKGTKRKAGAGASQRNTRARNGADEDDEDEPAPSTPKGEAARQQTPKKKIKQEEDQPASRYADDRETVAKRPEKKLSRAAWTDDETDFLIEEMKAVVPGDGRIDWAGMVRKGAVAQVWAHQRTSVDLKDKARNLTLKSRLPDEILTGWQGIFKKPSGPSGSALTAPRATKAS